jgi:phosphotransferase system enzyme I (PtsI)
LRTTGSRTASATATSTTTSAAQNRQPRPGLAARFFFFMPVPIIGRFDTPIECRYTPPRMLEFAGISASPGIAIGRAFLFLEDKLAIPRYAIPSSQVETEQARFAAALARAAAEVRALAATGNPVVDAHLLMLEDPELVDAVRRGVGERCRNAEWIVAEVMDAHAERLGEAGTAYLRERALDLHDVGQRLIGQLLEHRRASLADAPEGSIVVTRTLMPSDTLQIDRRRIAGIAADGGSRTSHTAILARSLGIPAVLGLADFSRHVRAGDAVAIDGNRGVVVVDPDEPTRGRYARRKAAWEEATARLAGLNDLPAETLDGKLVRLEANIGVPDEVDAVLSHGADGVGLFRSEFLFLQPGRFPTEDEQAHAYGAVLRALGDRPVTIRTLDLGGDKIAPGFALAAEANPILGWRAIRYCLAHPEVFRVQLRALLRASVHGTLRIMFPLISGAAELERIREVLAGVRDELEREGIPFRREVPVGCMIEVPSAAITSDLLASRVDFFSIGTNDLIQYTLAVDRGNERVAYLYDPFHPAVLRLVRTTIANAHARGIPAGMCGEMAGDPLATVVLLGLGLDSFSMGPLGIPPIKRLVRAVGAMEAEDLVRSLLALPSGGEVAEAVRRWAGSRLEPTAE